MRSRRLPARLRSPVVAIPAVALGTALLLAAVALAIDDVVPPGALPPWLLPEVESARLLLGTSAGGLITATAVVFWVRGMLLQMASNQFSSRVLHRYVEDRFALTVMGYLLGALLYVVIVLLALPEPEAATPAPALSVLIGAAATIGAVAAIIAVIDNSSRVTQPGELLRRVADDTTERIRRSHPAEEAGATTEDARAAEPEGPGHEILAHSGGWVESVDDEALLAAIPPGATIRLDVRPGMLVVAGGTLCVVWLDWSIDEADLDRMQADVRAAVPLGSARSSDADVLLGLRHLVDVALATVGPARNDATVAYETILHIGAVLREVLQRGTPSAIVEDEDGRQLLRPAQLTLEEHVDAAFNPLREAAAGSPTFAIALLETLGMLRRTVRAAGLTDRLAPLQRQAELIVKGCEAAGVLPDDLARIADVSHRQGFRVDAPAAASQH